jgi:hypothetical protein
MSHRSLALTPTEGRARDVPAASPMWIQPRRRTESKFEPARAERGEVATQERVDDSPGATG